MLIPSTTWLLITRVLYLVFLFFETLYILSLSILLSPPKLYMAEILDSIFFYFIKSVILRMFFFDKKNITLIFSIQFIYIYIN